MVVDWLVVKGWGGSGGGVLSWVMAGLGLVGGKQGCESHTTPEYRRERRGDKMSHALMARSNRRDTEAGGGGRGG